MTPAIPSNYANAVAPFTPLGRTPVGQETEDLRGSTLQPLEESAESARGENQRSPDQRPGELDEAVWLNQRRTGAGELGAGAQADPESQASPEPYASQGSRNDANGAGRPSGEAATPEERARAEREVRDQLERREALETQREIRELAERDREVRLHEQAHAALGGRYAGAPQYEYERGPDGVAYAVSGEVPIDTSKIPNDPQALLEKAQQIRRAAFAPAEPSDTDRRVAAEAARMEAEARAALRQQKLEQAEDASGDTSGSDNDRASAAQGESGRANDVRSEEEKAREQERADDRQALTEQMRRRNIDTYLQLVELTTLTAPPSPGDRLDQRA